MVTDEMKSFLRQEAKARFLSYVQIDTTSDPQNNETPSAERERDLANLLKQELLDLGISNAEVDEHCYVYATIPASEGVIAPPVSFIAHMDTAPSEPGDNVKPIVHSPYDGKTIQFPDNPELTLSLEDSPLLLTFVGEEIITASGLTLLGADDKAGVAEIMTAAAAWQKYPELQHPEIRICFTPDEEIGAGTVKISLDKLGQFAYTVDGSQMGELEDECFDAHWVKLHFIGKNVHPGMSKRVMINAGAIAARFVAALPEAETPEHTMKREGFYHVTEICGNANDADVEIIIRDFEAANNQLRIQYIESLSKVFQLRYPGLQIELSTHNSYRNMVEVLRNFPQVLLFAEQAISAADLPVKREPIRGGTDGARLSFMGLPTPNLFAGGMLFHSKKEWIPVVALQKAAEVIIHLGRIWAEQG
jgi:tripeptide aminopeptidase